MNATYFCTLTKQFDDPRGTSDPKSLTQGNFHARIRSMTTANHRNLRIRVRPYLDDLRARKTTNRAVAEELGCNEQTLCRVLKGVGLEKEAPVDRKAIADLAAERRRFRERVANTMPPEEAAKAAGVSLRTIYRYIKK